MTLCRRKKRSLNKQREGDGAKTGAARLHQPVEASERKPKKSFAKKKRHRNFVADSRGRTSRQKERGCRRPERRATRVEKFPLDQKKEQPPEKNTETETQAKSLHGMHWKGKREHALKNVPSRHGKGRLSETKHHLGTGRGRRRASATRGGATSARHKKTGNITHVTREEVRMRLVVNKNRLQTKRAHVILKQKEATV